MAKRSFQLLENGKPADISSYPHMEYVNKKYKKSTFQGFRKCLKYAYLWCGQWSKRQIPRNWDGSLHRFSGSTLEIRETVH